MGVKYTGPDLSIRGMSKVMKEALDDGLKHHQDKHLPGHFEESAKSKYSEAYKKKGGRPQTKGHSLRERLKNMNSRQRAKWYADRRKEQKVQKNNKQTNKRGKKKPLVKSGLLKKAVTKGNPKFTGPPKRRKMTIPTPVYLNFHKPGQIHKKDALQATIPKEDQAVSRVIQKKIDRHLKEKKNKKI